MSATNIGFSKGMALFYMIGGSIPSVIPALITVLGTVVFRVSWVYTVFPHWNTLASLLAVYPISWLLTGAMMVSYYFYVRRRCLRSDAPDSEDGSGQGDYGAETQGA